jgi:hypothetical protein
MKEDFMYFLWKYRLLKPDLMTTQGLAVRVINPGMQNKDSGPDFFAAQVHIGDTLWAGNIEIHINSSDWNRHGHQDDDAYGNIILHVVMKHDMDILDKKGNVLPVLELQSCFERGLLGKYESILASKTWVPCENYIPQANSMIVMNWLSRLLVERLENKTGEIIKFLKYFDNNWEQTFYYFLSRNFGFKVNSSPFALLSQNTPYALLAKHKNDLTLLEALLFGQAGMLEQDFHEAYPELLKKEYQFLRHKYNLQPMDKSLWKFGKLRPSNFPTIRISQFARLIHLSSGLFSKIMECDSFDQIQKLLAVNCTPYWESHYVFDKTSSRKTKNLGRSAIENLTINTIVPLKFIYGVERMKPQIKDQAVALLAELPPEENATVSKWDQAGIKAANAAESQALLELKKYYCTPRKCLDCSIGLCLIKNNQSN